MVRDVPICDRVLIVLLAAMEKEKAAMLETQEVARRAGVPVNSLVHAMPLLFERGHLDPRTPSGTLKLSVGGTLAARSVVAA